MNILIVVVTTICVMFAGPFVGVIGGAFCGWIVGLVFDATLTTLIAWMGLDFAPWQFGAILGFIGGFFKNWQLNTND